MKETIRYGYTRAQEIELSAKTLVAWCNEFVADVLDHNGLSLLNSGEWQEILGDLELALEPLEPVEDKDSK